MKLPVVTPAQTLEFGLVQISNPFSPMEVALLRSFVAGLVADGLPASHIAIERRANGERVVVRIPPKKLP